MRAFFKQELKNLQAKTGIRQLENMMLKEKWQDEANKLIEFMIEECNKPPFNIVATAVKERVISRAIVEDQEFIGLNAKFVRRALNAWWLTNGDRVIEACNAKSSVVYERVELTPEQSAKIDVMAKEYIQQLLSGDTEIKSVPQLTDEEIKREGKEFEATHIVRKATKYSNGFTIEQIAMIEKLDQAKAYFNKGITNFGGYTFYNIEGFQIFARDEKQAQDIYDYAVKL